MIEDSELLRQYADDRSESAFAALVQRHLNLVYFAALRRTSNRTIAEDVTQYVFTTLARDAAKLSRHITLVGWLYMTTRFAAAKALRSENRRKIREQEAQLMNEFSASPPTVAEWEKIRPVLDAAMDQLPARDREAVLLRCLEGRAFTEIGQTLQVSEDAARMRVDRTLDKLRDILARRGVTSTGAALAALLADEAAASAPTGLATSVLHSALAGSTPLAAGLALKLTTLMTTAKVSLLAAGVIAIATSTIAVRQTQSADVLKTQVAALTARNAELVAERRETTSLRAELTTQEQKALAEHEELMRLRAGVEAYRKQQALAKAKSQPAPSAEGKSDPAMRDTSAMVPVGMMQNVGRATPRASAQTQLWARQSGDIDLAASLITMEPAERSKLEAFIPTLPDEIRQKYDTPEKLMSFLLAGAPTQVSSVQLLHEEQPNPDEVIQQVQLQFGSGEVRQDTIRFRRNADGWQQVMSPSTVDRLIAYFGHKP